MIGVTWNEGRTGHLAHLEDDGRVLVTSSPRAAQLLDELLSAPVLERRAVTDAQDQVIEYERTLNPGEVGHLEAALALLPHVILVRR